MRTSPVLATAALVTCAALGWARAGYPQRGGANVPKSAVPAALQRYGWALPICVWPIRRNVSPFCVSVSRLLKTYPYYTQYISETIYRAAEAAYAAEGMTERCRNA